MRPTIGQIIVSQGIRHVVTAIYPSGRKFNYFQISASGEKIGGECRAWTSQINGRGNAATSYGARLNFSVEI